MRFDRDMLFRSKRILRARYAALHCVLVDLHAYVDLTTQANPSRTVNIALDKSIKKKTKKNPFIDLATLSDTIRVIFLRQLRTLRAHIHLRFTRTTDHTARPTRECAVHGKVTQYYKRLSLSREIMHH